MNAKAEATDLLVAAVAYGSAALRWEALRTLPERATPAGQEAYFAMRAQHEALAQAALRYAAAMAAAAEPTP